MDQDRRNAAAAGVLYLVTHITSVGAVVLYGGGLIATVAALRGRESVLVGALFEVVLAAAVVGTSLALYPMLRRHGFGLAQSYVALRVLEASVILTGVVTILPVVAVPTTTAAPALDPGVADGLLLVHDWTFLVGPGLINPVNTVVLAWLLFHAGLVPRWIPVLGLVGAPLIAVMNLAVMFGWTAQQPIVVVPIFAWEISLAIYLIVRGLRPAATLTLGTLEAAGHRA